MATPPCHPHNLYQHKTLSLRSHYKQRNYSLYLIKFKGISNVCVSLYKSLLTYLDVMKPSEIHFWYHNFYINFYK